MHNGRQIAYIGQIDTCWLLGGLEIKDIYSTITSDDNGVRKVRYQLLPGGFILRCNTSLPKSGKRARVPGKESQGPEAVLSIRLH